GEAHVLRCTHTGIKWHRALPDGSHAVNVGVIGRPENDGATNVWYTVLTATPDLQVEFVPVAYDPETLDREIVRGADPHRGVDDLSGEPAGPRARPRKVLSDAARPGGRRPPAPRHPRGRRA